MGLQVKRLDELDRRAWAGAQFDDDPGPLRDPVAMAYGADGPPLATRKWYDWPQQTRDTFDRLLELAR